METFIKIQNKLGCKFFITGGYVRDLVIGRKSKDIDVLCVGTNLNILVNELGRFGKAKINKANGIDVLNFLVGADEIQITTPKGMPTLNDINSILATDASERDFRMNALYLPINHKGSIESIIDFTGGILDVCSNRVDFNDNYIKLIEDSPVRMLRAISLAAKLGFSLTSRTVDIIKNNAGKITLCNSENLRDELNDILLSNEPSKYIELLRVTGLLKYVLPELDSCYGVTQNNKHHKYDVYTHIVRAVDNAVSNLEIRMAALLHDIGKVNVRAECNGNITFHKHELTGAKAAGRILSRLRYSKDFINQVVHLVKHHMYHYDRNQTDSAVRRLMRNINLTEEYMDRQKIRRFPLFQLRVADRLGNGYKNIPITPKQKDMEERMLRLYAESNCFSVKNLKVDGNDLMTEFGLKPGIIIGHILNKLLEAVLDNPELNNKEDLLKLSMGIIENYLIQNSFEFK